MAGMKAGKGNSPKVLVLGVGNLLLGDDGVGGHLIKSLEGTQFPENVRVLEAGTVSHRLITLFHSVGYLIIIDAVEAGDRPGSIFRVSPDEVSLSSKQKLALHQMGIADILQMAELSGAKPETVTIGVQPKDASSWSLELTEEVKAAIPRVKELVFEELRKIKAM